MPLSTELPVGDLYEFVGNFRLNGDGPPTTGRLGLARLQELLLTSSSLVGARFLAAEKRLTDVETLAAQVPGIDGRLKSVEAFTGVGNSNLALDLADILNTRFWGRPGEAFRTWTADIGTLPAASAPLTANSFFSYVVGPGGKALRITGNAYAGPDALVRIDKGRTVEFNFTVSRAVDDPVPANNTVQIGFRTFNPAGQETGSISIPVGVLNFKEGVDGVVTYTALISRTPGVGTVDLPAGAIDVRPWAGNLGTTGALNVYGIDYRERITLATLIEAGGLVSTIPDAALIGLDVNGVSQKISFKDFKKMFTPDVYTSFETIDVGTSSHVLVGADPNMVEINWQSAGADVAACATYNRATLDLKTPSVLAQDGGSGRIKFGKDGAKAPISFIASTACPVTIEITRLTQNYTKYKLFGDDMMSYWPRQDLDERFRAVMRTALNNSETGKLLEKAKFLFCSGAYEENDAINLFNPEGPRLTYNRGTTGLVTTPHAGVKGGGTDAYVETNQPTTSFDPNSHFMLCMVGSTALDPDGIQIGNSANYYLSSNITTTKGGARTGSGRDDLPSAPAQMIAFNRLDAGNYNQFVNGVKVGQTIARPTSSVPGGTLKLLAIPASGGVTAVSKLPLILAASGEGFNDDITAMRRFYEAWKPVMDMNAVIRAELVASGGAA